MGAREKWRIVRSGRSVGKKWGVVRWCTSSLVHYSLPRARMHAGVKQCHRVCVCVSKKYLRALQSGYLGYLEMLNSLKNNQWNHIGTFMYLTQVKAVLFTIISATSYYQLSVSWLHPFRNHTWYLQSANQLRTHKIKDLPGIDLACLTFIMKRRAWGK